MKLLMDYPWRGNVRELENVIERIALLVDKNEITPEDLPPDITSYPSDKKFVPDLTIKGVDVDEIMGDIEKKYLLNALDLVGGVKTEAAKLLNLSFRSFRHRLQKYGIK
jgi:two-component system response regulator PilR (NtrC family)